MESTQNEPEWATGKPPRKNNRTKWILGIIALFIVIWMFNYKRTDYPKTDFVTTDHSDANVITKDSSTIANPPVQKLSVANVLANDDFGELLPDTDIHIARMNFLLKRAAFLYKQPIDSLAYLTINLKRRLHDQGVAVSNQEILEYIKGFRKIKDVSYQDALQVYYIYKLQ